MPIRPVPDDLPDWSPRKFSRAIEADRARTKERKTAIVLRLATTLGTTPQTIYAWRKGEGRPELGDAIRIAYALGVSVFDLTE